MQEVREQVQSVITKERVKQEKMVSDGIISEQEQF